MRYYIGDLIYFKYLTEQPFHFLQKINIYNNHLIQYDRLMEELYVYTI